MDSTTLCLDWRKLFGGAEKQSLIFFPPKVSDGISMVKPPPAVIDEGIAEWNHLLILENGPWHVQNKPLVLRKWEPSLQKLDFYLKHIPDWVQLYNVPLELYSRTSLSYIASTVGHPLYMDAITASKERLEYAKVCVEIGAGAINPKLVNVLLNDGFVVKIRVFVPWLPKFCQQCKTFGHHTNVCAEAIPAPVKSIETQFWRKKYVPTSVESNGFERLADKKDAISDLADKGVKQSASVEVRRVEKKGNVGSSSKLEMLAGGGGYDRKPRAAAMGVTVLLNEIRAKNKDMVDKVKGSDYSAEKGKVFKRLESLGVDMVCLMETIIRSINISKWVAILSDKWNYLANYDFVDGGRIWVLWKKRLSVSVVGGSDQALSILGDAAGHSVMITAVYGSNNNLARRGLWDYLRNLESVVEELQGCMDDLELQDHPFVGPLFTWSNKQEGSYLARKLDRILINSQWMHGFPISFADYKAPGVSDHCLGDGNAMQVLFNKLKRLKPILKELNRTNFSDIFARVKDKRAELEQIQLSNLTVVNHVGMEVEKRVQSELIDLEITELDFYRQRAKVHWLQEGDLSTKIFHQKVESQKKKNTIRMLKNEYGDLLETFDEMVDILNYSLPDGAERIMAGEVSNKEIKDALFRQGRDKSPGPDGYTSWFFKVAWEFVNKDFLNAVRHFFQTTYLLPAFNATTIVLVPKSLNASMAKEFRPISCCSVIYKTITRTLVTRLAQFFPGMISASQYAFVKGKSISDNTLLAQEIVRGYSRKNLSPRCAIKVDLQKAFDSISWEFLLNVLVAMGLPQKFCNWIRVCVTTPRYSIALNGSLVGYFRGARGVRQGDPLSPYLFVMVINFLSSLLDAAIRNDIFRFHPRCNRISFTHLCFADDLLLFYHGSLDSMMGVLSILDKFYDLSGLKLNAMKTKIFTCGVPGGELEQIRIATGFRVGQLPVRYLGVPLVTRKLSGTDCRALLEKIKGKLRQWSSRKLSYGGRLQLIKVILFSIFSYWSRQLILPKGVIQDFERVCMRFFWKGNDSPAHGARVSWSQICSPKSEGGLGLRSLVGWNQACCLMLIKNLLADEGSLWIAWVKAYCFKHEDYWNIESKPHFNWTLRKLIKMRVQAGTLFTASVNWSQARGGWIWDKIRERKDKMAILDRLPTKERLVRFVVVSDARCGFCDDDLESRSHLFLDCPYSREVWASILHLCGLQQQYMSWIDWLCWLNRNLKGKSLLVHILKLAWTGWLTGFSPGDVVELILILGDKFWVRKVQRRGIIRRNGRIGGRGDGDAGSSGNNDGWLGLTHEPNNGLAVGLEPEFPSELEDPSGTNRWQPDASVSAVDLCMAVFGASGLVLRRGPGFLGG
ncbi:hypothetical protein F3Y22_tig00002237pilonHSYRG01790 [Hibiscus syriacus]|uniref:Reverse transcriptase domain-containing protein n=1 Tax=Hibiscus syriacus TaxID=106335 RepID=A0A6A3CYM0_HIBSY|nr:hypothetical protein F3Y22_tig00002237pilonHSYRG01790 [Hibiscus syriacus]